MKSSLKKEDSFIISQLNLLSDTFRRVVTKSSSVSSSRNTNNQRTNSKAHLATSTFWLSRTLAKGISQLHMRQTGGVTVISLKNSWSEGLSTIRWKQHRRNLSVKTTLASIQNRFKRLVLMIISSWRLGASRRFRSKRNPCILAWRDMMKSTTQWRRKS